MEIQILVRDRGNGKVECKCSPSFQTLAKLDLEKREISPATVYAMAMMKFAMDISKEAEKDSAKSLLI